MINSTILVTKRSGKSELYSREKLRLSLHWAVCNSLDYKEDTIVSIVDGYLDELEVGIYEAMPTTVIFSKLLSIVTNSITRISQDNTFVASKLYLLQIYRSSMHNIKPFRPNSYPNLKDVLTAGVNYGHYSKDIVNTYNDNEVNELNSYIRLEEDYTFTYNAAYTFVNKYCKRIGGKYTELPQITYMRVAMGLLYDFVGEKETKLKKLGYTRIEAIKSLYDVLTLGQVTLGSTIINNAMTDNASMSNCVLNTLGNNTFDIHNKAMTAALYTKAQGGMAFDISLVQAKGTVTDRGVKASGIIPYIKMLERVILSMAQSDNRKGAGVVTCSWWHSEIMSFLELKDNSSGTEENRAVHLVYSLATNDYLYEKVINGGTVNLFNPIDTPLLNSTHGEEWKKHYNDYSNSLIHRETIDANTLFEKHLKYDYETGHQYEILLDNVNRQGMLNRHVASSNLCVIGTTFILTDKGYKHISTLAGATHNCWNGKVFSPTPIYKVSEEEEVYKVTLSDGSKLMCTAEHRWITIKGVCSTIDLSKGLLLPLFKDGELREGKDPHIVFPKAYNLKVGGSRGRDFIPPFENTFKSFMFWFKSVMNNGAHSVKVYGDNLVMICNSPMYARRLRLALQERGFASEVVDSTIYFGQSFSDALGYNVDIPLLPSLYIKNIKKLDRLEPVYCGTEPMHGSLQFNGVITKNCSEILEVSSPATFMSEELDGDVVITKSKDEEIALCNLASYNLIIDELDDDEYRKVITITSIALDNTIDISYYHRAAAKKSNVKYRYTGQGQSNLAYVMAKAKIKMDTKEGLIKQVKIFDRLSATIWDVNCDLAEVLGTPEGFKGTKWEEGILPIDVANEYTYNKFKEYIDHDRLDAVRKRVSKGVRNITMMATAPTASSANAKGLRDSIEPIHALEYRLEGAVLGRIIVPEINELGEYYTLAFESNQSMLIMGTAIRQMFIDQSQSANRYVKLSNANYDYLKALKILAWKTGVKTHYYLNSEKEDSSVWDIINIDEDGIETKPEDGIVELSDEGCLTCGS